MTDQTPAVQPKSRLRKVFRFLGIAFAVLIAVIVTAHFTWKYSGSGQWKQEIAKNGITVYSRKMPGRALKDIRAVRHINYSLMVTMAAMTNGDVKNCADWLPGCESAKNVVPYDPKEISSTDLYVIRYPRPWAPREYVIRTQIAQDAASKAVSMVLRAAPDVIPRNKCCYRIADMENRWRFTPNNNGVDVDFTMHMDQGLPYFMVNRMSPRIIYRMFDEMPRRFSKPEYQTKKISYIRE